MTWYRHQRKTRPKSKLWTQHKRHVVVERRQELFAVSGTLVHSGANATNSKLLALPPEIRNRVYGYVLGGNTIHVTYDWQSSDRLQRALCLCPRADEVVLGYGELGQSKAPGEFADEWADRHKRCMRNKPRFVFLYDDYPDYTPPAVFNDNYMPEFFTALLETCKQIHQEAALLPFALNHFAFGSPTKSQSSEALNRFLTSLIPSQTRSIHAITLSIGFYYQPTIKSVQSLQGLRTLRLFATNTSANELDELGRALFLRKPFYLDVPVCPGLTLFERCPIKDVFISIGLKAGVSEDAAVSLLKALKERLVKTWDSKAYMAKKEVSFAASEASLMQLRNDISNRRRVGRGLRAVQRNNYSTLGTPRAHRRR